MAYRALLNNRIFFRTDSNDFSLTSAKLERTVGTAGSFKFVIPPDNKYYNSFHKIIDYVDVYRDDDLLFSGRVYSIEKAFDTQLRITCEGLFTVFNDSVFRPITFQGQLKDLILQMLDSHNEQVEPEKQIRMGYFFVDNSDCYRAYQNYESTISRLQDLAESYGGWMQVRKDSEGVLWFDWYDKNRDGVNQTIDFGENLLDIKQEENTDGIVTVLIPLGAQNDDGTRLTIKLVNDTKDYIVAEQQYLDKYGYVAGVKIWDDVNYPGILKTKGLQWLTACLTPKKTINLTAVDLADAGFDVESFNPGQVVKVNSAPHGINGEWFDVNTQSLDLLNPAQNKLSVGTQKIGFIKAARSETAETKRTLEQIVDKYTTKSAFELAVDNLTNAITGSEGGFKVERDTDGDGYIDEILFMDTTSVETARNVWRINQNGWAHSSTGIDGPYTMGASLDDGFLAKFIQAGYLNADLIRTGVIRSQNGQGSYWNLNTGELHIEGEVSLDKSKNFYSKPSPPYYVGDLWITGRAPTNAMVDDAIAGDAIVDDYGEGSDVGGTIFACCNTKTSGEFEETDWILITSYVSDADIQALNQRITQAELNVSQMDAKIEGKASREEFDPIYDRLYAAEQTIDGYNARIDLATRYSEEAKLAVADKSKTFREEPTPPYYIGDTWVTGNEPYAAYAGDEESGPIVDDAKVDWGGEIWICINEREDGTFNWDDWMPATKYVDDSQLQSVRQEIRTAELEIDAVNARIDLKANASTVTGLMKRVRSAEIAIDGDNARIEMLANASVETELGRRLNSAELSVDAHEGILAQVTEEDQISGTKLIGFINLNSTTAKIHASQIELEGEVYISSLSNSAKTALVTNADSWTEFYLSTSASQTAEGSWSSDVPTWSSGKYIWTRTATKKTNAKGEETTSYSGAKYDKNLTNALSTATSAQTTANAAADGVSIAQARQTATYVICNTAAGTAAKDGSCDGFTLFKGATITVYFGTANTAANPTLNVNRTGAKPIWVKNAAIAKPYYWRAQDTVQMTYDGSHWVMSESSAATIIASWCVNNDTTYINGASIATGTIAADRIQANAMFTQHMTAQNLDITGGAITVTATGFDDSYIHLNHRNIDSWFGARWCGFEITDSSSSNYMQTVWGFDVNAAHTAVTNQYIGFTQRINSVSKKSWLSAGSLIFQPTGVSSRSVTLTGDSIVFTYGSTTAGIETNNGSWGCVAYADYIWAKRGVVDNSDARLKKDIRYLDKIKASEFIYSLKPVQFEFINSPKWIHHGFITRDVKAYDGWQLVVKNPDGFEALAQTEIIADLVATVQSLNERIKKLEGNA